MIDRQLISQLDAEDPVGEYRQHFHIPPHGEGKESIYLCGNSLGLQPKKVREYVLQELEDWKTLGVEGHTEAHNPWMPYHELLTSSTAKLVGAKEHEVVVMNSLTVNLHLLMGSFYRPTPDRYKILIESDAFPSDLYAVQSQLKLQGYDPEDSLIIVAQSPGKAYIEEEDIFKAIEEHKDDLALVMIGGVNYYTGQFFDLDRIARSAHHAGALVGFDLAHAAGNVPLQLHEWNVDFAAWCSYKYLNSGPGGLSGCFIHERHGLDASTPRWAGWWGHNKSNRFEMRHAFDPIPGAEGWQLSNPPILPLASLRASMEIFDKVGMDVLRQKSKKMNDVFLSLIHELEGVHLDILTPKGPARRGCQLSIKVRHEGRKVFEYLTARGVIMDWREPDVIRVAPVPLYNSYQDIFDFVQLLKEAIHHESEN